MPFKISQIPVITTEVMRQVDRLMLEKYGIQLIQMMENAGRNLADLAHKMLEDSVADKKIFIVVGKGNNGGGGLVAARHLYNRGACVTVLLTSKNLKHIVKKQLQILRRFPIEIRSGDEALAYLENGGAHLVIDALIGYGLQGKPRGRIAKMIGKINALKIPVLSLDTPSGLNVDTGESCGLCIKADSTLTLALPKIGLVQEDAKPFVGDLFLADISVPDVLYKELGIEVDHIFMHDSIVELNAQPQLTFRNRCTGIVLG